MLERLLPFVLIGIVVSFAMPEPHDDVLMAACVLLLLLLLFMALWCKRMLLPFLCVLIGMGYGVWQTERALASQWQEGVGQSVPVSIRVTDLPLEEERRVRFTAEVRDASGNQYQLRLSDYLKREWQIGSVWQAEVRVKPIVGEVNTAGYNREAWALSEGLDGIGSVGKTRRLLLQGSDWGIAAMRQKISQNWQALYLEKHDFSDGIALMKALSIGEQQALAPQWWQIFRPLGITHLVSISGLHVTMVALWFGLMMKLLLRLLPFDTAKPRLWILVASSLGALLYALLAGFSIPTQRSVLMLAAFAWAWYRADGVSPWRIWWQALAAVLLFDPMAVLSVGTWLSFGLVAALVWISAGRLNRMSAWAIMWRSQWAASVVSLVLLAQMFAVLPLLSPLINAIAIPWFSWVLTPLALVATLLPFEPLQLIAAALAEYTLHGLRYAAQYAPEYAVAAAPLLLTALAFAAAWLVLLPRGMGLRIWAWLVLLMFLLYRPENIPERRLKITVMDAGQGLSVLMQTRDKNLLFDTGTAQVAAGSIIPSLDALGVRHLDAVVLSHHDADHDGGFPFVAARFQADKLWAGQPAFYSGAILCRETHWQWNGVDFELLDIGEAVKDDNGQSCVLRVSTGGQAVLITGDLGKKGEAVLLDKYGESLYSNILLLGHHGSSSSSSSVFLNAVAPQYGVSSSGYGNAYGHPTLAVQNRLKAHGIRLLRTDKSGALLFELGGGKEVYSGRLKRIKFYWQKKPME